MNDASKGSAGEPEVFQSAAPGLDVAAFRAVFEQAPSAMIVLDREGRVLMWNRNAETLTGWTAAEIVGQLVPYVPPEGWDTFRVRHAEAFAGGPMPELVIQRRTRTGELRDLSVARNALRDANGDIFGILGILVDVTDRRREEATHRRDEENLRGIIERAPEAIAVHRFGQIVYANPHAVALLGFRHADDLVGRPILSFIREADRAVAVERVRRTLEEGIDAPPLEEVFIRSDGTDLPVEVTALRILFDGQPSVLVFARDLRERKRLEAQMRTVDRLASLGRLASGVGHEINNPLSYVMGNLELVDQALNEVEPELRARLREHIADAHEGADRVRLIVRDLKVFSRSDAEDRESLDVRRVLYSCVNMAMPEIRKVARLERRYEETPPVLVNEARLAQVFLNLLMNAAQAIPDGASTSHVIAIATHADDPTRVTIEVSDDGAGMTAETRARIFEPFFTTRGGRGTGLGMAICQNLVSEMGGTIAVASTVGKGTKVTVVLPAVTIDAAPPSAHVSPQVTQKAVKRRILVVDDERLVATTVAAILSDHDTEVVSSGREAIARIDAEPFDLVLCDLMMPEIGGIDIFEHVRAHWPGRESRIVFMTGGAFTPRASRFLDEVPNAWIEKPFRIDELVQLVTKVLDGLPK